MTSKTLTRTLLAVVAAGAFIAWIIAGQMYKHSLQNDPTRLNLPTHFVLKDETWSKQDRMAMFVESEDESLVYAEIGASRDGQSIEFDLVNGTKLLGGKIDTSSQTGDLVVIVTNWQDQPVAAFDHITDQSGASTWTVWDNSGEEVAQAKDGPDELTFQAPDGTLMATISRDQTKTKWIGTIHNHGNVPEAVYALIAGYRMSLELNH